MTPLTTTAAAVPPGTRQTLIAAAMAGWSAAWYAAYAWAALVRLDLHAEIGWLLIAVTILGALFVAGIARPLATAALVLLVIPLFGNHPGGRLMELIHLPLAASAAGLAIEARLQRRPPLAGPLWLAAGLYVASAVIAIVPTLPALMVRAAQVNHWPTTVAVALTAPETDPLYSLSSLAGVTLAAAWAAALAWRAPDPGFYRAAVRMLIWVFFAVVALGVLDYFGAVNLVSSYLLRIDPRRPDVSGLQSIFWNPGWFAWYFVMIFALAIGFLWTASRRERYVAGSLLAASYPFSFLNPQRGGLVAVHVCLGLAAWLFLRRSGHRRAARLMVPAAAAAVAVAVAGAYALELIPRGLGSSLFRLLETPDEAVTSTSVRLNLWTVAVQMWRDAPVFGLGEGSFAWRFEDYAPEGSALFTPVHGDAHSTWFQVLATRGVAGVAALAALLWALARTLRAAWASGADRGLLIACGLSLIGFLVYSLVQEMFYLQAIQILFWFLLACVASAAPVGVAARPAWRPALIAAAAATALAVQAWFAAPSFERASETIARHPRGFYAVETSDLEAGRWRWSAAREGTLCLQPQGPRAELRLTADDPRFETYPRTVTVRVNGATVDTVTLTSPAAVMIAVPMPWWSPRAPQPDTFGECTGGREEVRLTVTVDRTWSPLAVGLGEDPRTFGVRVFEPVYP